MRQRCPAPDGKGVGEVVAATLAVLTAVEPTHIPGWSRRSWRFCAGMRAAGHRLRVGDIELVMEQPSGREVAAIDQIHAVGYGVRRMHRARRRLMAGRYALLLGKAVYRPDLAAEPLPAYAMT